MNYFPLYIGDYEKDAGHLSLNEEAAYFRLIKRYYATERPIPDVDKYRVTKASSPEDKAAVDTVLREFFKREGEAWRHSYADRVIDKAQRKIEANRANGIFGGQPGKVSRARVPGGTQATGPKLGPQRELTGPELGSLLEPTGPALGSPPEPTGPALGSPTRPYLKTNNSKEEEKKKKRAAGPPAVVVTLPDFIEPKAWDEYLEMRRMMKKPPTQHAAELVLHELKHLHLTGHDANAVLNNSIRNNWSDVFKPKHGDDPPASLATKNYSAGVQADGSF